VSAFGAFKAVMTYSHEISPDIPVYYFPHHLSHAASAYLTSGFESAAVVVADGVGEETCASIWRASRSGIHCLWRDEYPDSFGLMYSYLTDYLGFHSMQDEYKVMGLAAWGEPRYLTELERVITFSSDAHVRVAPDWVMSILTGAKHPGGLDETLL